MIVVVMGVSGVGKTTIGRALARELGWHFIDTDGLARFEIVYLHGSFELISARLAERPHHYMPASLLASQFATLEPPVKALAVDVAAAPSACVAAILARLSS